MKSKIIIILLFIAEYSNAQIINFPDINLKTKLLTASSNNIIAKNLNGNYFKIDINSDGEIQQSEALQVSYLNISNYLIPIALNISNLTGIEYFTNLTYLNCKNNILNNLNVSNNLMLTDLICNYNHLTSLNISNNDTLTTLNCSFNFLTNLNLTNAIAISSLTCNSNSLTDLNVSNNLSLTELICYANQLSSLDISSNIVLSKLNCNSNQLTNLNVNNNVALSELRCINNQLTTLNTNNNILLRSLICENNQISNLNLSNNIMLTYLSCSSNQLSNLNVCENTSLTSLICNSNQLTSLNIKNGKDEYLSFANNPNLNYICADTTQLSDVQNQINNYGIGSTCQVNDNCPLSNNQFTFRNFYIYPNPIKDFIQFNISKKILKVEVYDISGKLLISDLIVGNKLNLSELKAGNYFLKVFTESEILNTKIVKE